MNTYRKLRILTLVLCLVFAVPAFSGTIDFSGLTPGYGPDTFAPHNGLTPKGEIVTNQYLGLGVLFSIDAYGAAYASSGTYASSPATGNYLAVNTIPANSPTNWTTLSISFWDPSNSAQMGWVAGSSLSIFAADTNDSPANRVILRTYDPFGVQLETLNLTSASSTLTFSTGLVHQLRVLDSGGDGHQLDNLAFGVIHTPEPGTFLLMGAGLLGLGLAIRRRRA